MLNKDRFLLINRVTIAAVILLIAVGSIVRSLGAGMGCPDWPKCFGSVIPPTDSAQLPEDYQQVFKAERLKKNERLAQLFTRMGFEYLADKITSDPSIQEEQAFSATKAWVEYINRLVGVLIGLFVFLHTIFAFAFRKSYPWVPVVAIMVFVLTGFQGWVGSLVVSTNLLHGFITFHMLVALLILGLLIWVRVKATMSIPQRNPVLFVVSLITLLALLVQVILGAEVRGVIDELIMRDTPRSEWAASLDQMIFYIHRSFSWLLLMGAAGIYYLVGKMDSKELKRYAGIVLGLVGVAMVVGVGMVSFSFKAWMQPLHLILATGLFSLLFYLNLQFKLR